MNSYTLVLPEAYGERIDYKYHNPETIEKFKKLRNTQLKDRVLIQLKNVATIKGGKRLPKGTVFGHGERDIIPYVRLIDVKNFKIDFENCERIPPEIHEEIKNYQLKEGNVVITIVGTVGNVGLVDRSIDVCNFTENIAKITVFDENVINKFIMLFLDSELGRIQTDRFSVGSLQYKLSLASCRKLEIFIPNTKNNYDQQEQIRILTEFDNYERLADNKIRNYEEKIKQYKKYFIDLFKIDIPEEDVREQTFGYELSEHFGDRIDVLFNNPKRDKLLQNIEKHVHRRLGDLAKIQPLGQFVPTAFYNLVELEGISEDLGEVINIQEVPELNSGKMVFRKGEILFSKLQPERGKIVLVDEKHEGCVGSTELVSLKIISEEIVDRYLYHILRSPYVLKQWEYSIRGCSRERIGEPEIYDTLIPFIDYDMQLKVIEELDKFLQEAKILLQEYRELREKAREIFLTELLKQ